MILSACRKLFALASVLTLVSCASNESSTASEADSVTAGDAPSGVALVSDPSARYIVYGVTSDGFVVYSVMHPGGGEGNGVFAISLDGGSPRSILADYTAGFGVTLHGRAVAIEGGVTGLVVWTAAGGAEPITVTAEHPYRYALDADGSRILYVTQAWDGYRWSAGSVYVAPTNDAAGAKLLVSGVHIGFGNCNPTFGFAGGRAVVDRCEDAHGPTRTLSVFDGAMGWPRTDLLTEPTQRNTSSDQRWVADLPRTGLITNTAEGLVWIDLRGGTPKVIDRAAIKNPPSFDSPGIVTDDGVALYLTAAGLMRSRVDTPAPELVLAGVKGINAFSTDGANLLAYITKANDSSLATDLWLVNDGGRRLSERSAWVMTQASWTPGRRDARAFTTDGAYALYLAVDGDRRPLYAASLRDGTPRMIVPAAVAHRAAAGSLVVYGDARVGSATSETTNLFVVDVASSSPPTPIAQGAGTSFGLSPDRSRVVVSWKHGVYVVPLR